MKAVSLDTHRGQLGQGHTGSFITTVQLFCKPKFIPKQSVLKMPLVIYFFSSQLISRQAFPQRVPPCFHPPPRLQLLFCQSEDPGTPFSTAPAGAPALLLIDCWARCPRRASHKGWGWMSAGWPAGGHSAMWVPGHQSGRAAREL